MAGLTNPPGLGDTEWDEEQWARAMVTVLPRFMVASEADWKPARSSSVDRTVVMAAGGGWTCGTWDYDPATASAQVAPNTSGVTRFDAIVSRTDWLTGRRTWVAITGSSTPPVAGTSNTPTDAGLNRIPLVRYDGIVAIVAVRSGVSIIAPGDVFDMRVWGSAGALTAAQRTYLDFMDLPIGAVVEIGNQLSIRGVSGWRDVSTRLTYVQAAAPVGAPEGSVWFQTTT